MAQISQARHAGPAMLRHPHLKEPPALRTGHTRVTAPPLIPAPAAAVRDRGR